MLVPRFLIQHVKRLSKLGRSSFVRCASSLHVSQILRFHQLEIHIQNDHTKGKHPKRGDEGRPCETRSSTKFVEQAARARRTFRLNFRISRRGRLYFETAVVISITC